MLNGYIVIQAAFSVWAGGVAHCHSLQSFQEGRCVHVMSPFEAFFSRQSVGAVGRCMACYCFHHRVLAGTLLSKVFGGKLCAKLS